MTHFLALVLLLCAVMGLFGLICVGLGKAFDYGEKDDAEGIDEDRP